MPFVWHQMSKKMAISTIQYVILMSLVSFTGRREDLILKCIFKE